MPNRPCSSRPASASKSSMDVRRTEFAGLELDKKWQKMPHTVVIRTFFALHVTLHKLNPKSVQQKVNKLAHFSRCQGEHISQLVQFYQENSRKWLKYCLFEELCAKNPKFPSIPHYSGELHHEQEHVQLQSAVV